MNHTRIPSPYQPKLNPHEVQLAIGFIKQTFQKALAQRLNLFRVSAPLFVDPAAGINDNLSGTERPVRFDIPAIDSGAEIVHSLAKWKRVALKKYGFSVHEGLFTDMNAIRRDEELDNLHSIYVDQWDWEKIITPEDRTPEYLRETVRQIVEAIVETNERLKEHFPYLNAAIKKDVTFIDTQDLEDRYPELSPEEREAVCTREYQTVFLMRIGDKLKSGIPHGTRSPDYDDWKLNGDLLVWDELLGRPIELSSMGIRVDPKSLEEQLIKSNCTERRGLYYHQMLLSNQLPLTIGGGIGQSRLCMLLMQCAHIGEVQSSLWDPETIEQCKAGGVPLL